MKNRSKYNPVAIGNRIKGLRTARKISQEKFVDMMRDAGAGMSKPTLEAIEKGKWGNFPTLNHLMAMCSIFDCDMGYLTCEYDSKTIVAEEMSKHTGLIESAIDTLHELFMIQQDNKADEKEQAATRHVMPFINQMLTKSTVQLMGAQLNEIAFATEYERIFGEPGKAEPVALRSRNSGIYGLFETFKQQADNLLGNPYVSMETVNRK